MTTKGSKLTSLIILVLMTVSLLPLGSGPAALAQQVQAGEPEPLPRECDDVTPVGETPPACCLYGYVYSGDSPVSGATVTIESDSGTLVTTTGSGGASSDPYSGVSLSDPPLSAAVGDELTITAEHGGMASSRTWTVLSGGQQVDLGLVATEAGQSQGQIAFQSTRDGNHELYIMEADGSNVRRLTFNSPGLDSVPAFSPDGSEIVFARGYGTDHTDLRIMSTATGDPDNSSSRLIAYHSTRMAEGAWSPDGKTIIFSMGTQASEEIYSVPSDGSAAPTRLTNLNGKDCMPDWSPDGSTIVFASAGGTGGWDGTDLDVYLMNPDGTNIRPLLDENSDPIDGGARWSPDGSKLLVGYNGTISTVNADGTGLTQIQSGASIGNWSPDGSQITYWAGDAVPTDLREIYIMNSDGSGTPTNISNSAGKDISPDWGEPHSFPTFADHTVKDNLQGARWVHSKDLDGDGDEDLLATGMEADSVIWWENDGSESFSNHVLKSDFTDATAVFAADMDGDGREDILASSFTLGDILWWKNGGTGSFVLQSPISSSFSGATQIYATDVDGDGDMDVLATALWADDIAWWENDGDENFSQHTIEANFDGAYSVHANDVDGDGDVDVLGAAVDADDVTWWENDGDENFGSHPITDTFDGPKTVFSIDLDQDGDTDVLSAASVPGDVVWWENDGDETFSDHIITTGFGGVMQVYATDLDSDGDIDVVGAAGTNKEVAWWENDGNERFIDHTIEGDFDGANSVYASDIDGDGNTDVLGSAYNDGDVVWWENQDPSPPEAEFSASPTEGEPALEVQFTDESNGDILAWDWDLDFDGTVDSGARHPEHTYNSAGNYTVSLTTTGPRLSDTETKQQYIEVKTPGTGIPVASINFIRWDTTPFPDPPVQGLDRLFFDGSGFDTDPDEGGWYITAYQWRSDLDGILSDQPRFSIPAAELSAGAHTISLVVQDDEGIWSPETTRPLTIVANQAAVRTLILVNRAKLASLYSSTQADQVMAKLNSLAAHAQVEGLVLQVESDAAVAAAYTAWDADPTSTAKANAVTVAIRSLILDRWGTYPDLEYLVIAGDDQAIPFRRVLDQTHHPESHYGPVSASSTTGAALKANMTLTDDYYADRTPTLPGSPGWDGHDLYIPDLGTGRLIESPSEIIAQVDTFLASDGLAADDAIVTGYDFLIDSADAICDRLQNDGLTTDCDNIGTSWTRPDFLNDVLNTRHDFASFNGHASHFLIGTPQQNVFSSDVAGASADHTQALFFTPGCHSGLNVPPTNPSQALDTAQAFIQQDALYIANTGYGWGYRTSVGLSEQLMLDLSERLTYGQSATVGQALAAAKQEYYLDDTRFDYYDEKILIESTLYGLPMLRYDTPASSAAILSSAPQGPAVIASEQETDLGQGLTKNSLAYQFPALLAETTDDGQYYVLGDGVHASDGEPLQPKYSTDLSFPGTAAHGIVFVGGAYADEASFDPVVEQAITETVPLSEATFDADNWYPSVLHRFNRLERGDRLNMVLGQFDADSATERIFDQLSFDVYYHTSSADWTGPSVPCIASSLEAGQSSVTVKASDASGIEAVVVAYTGGQGHWQSVELDAAGGAWSGSFPASAGSQFFVQVVDGAGNVTINDNDGAYFAPGEGSGCTFAVYLPMIQRTP